MVSISQSQAFHDMGDASFYMEDYHFNERTNGAIREYYPPADIGNGVMYQFQPLDGVFLSTSDWTPRKDMERQYQLNHKMIKIYYLESGRVTLIQNGKRAIPIHEGINLYLNRPSKGRVLYQAGIPIRYVSVLMLEDYFSSRLQERFTAEDFDYAELFSWREFDYNTP